MSTREQALERISEAMDQENIEVIDIGHYADSDILATALALEKGAKLIEMVPVVKLRPVPS